MTNFPRTLIFGGILFSIFLLGALVSFIWTPADVEILQITARFKLPSTAHWFGTDHFGRDIFSMIMVGARTSIAVAVVAVGIGIALGVPLGLWAAANHGHWLDDLIMRGNDLVFAFPSLIIAILITAVFGPSAFNAIIAIGIFNIPVLVKVTRSGKNSQLSRYSNSFLGKKIFSILRLNTYFVAITPDVFSELIALGVDRDKVFSISNGVLKQKNISTERDEIKIVFLGRLIKRKRVELLIKSFQNIKNQKTVSF